jgi:hypothetical protein
VLSLQGSKVPISITGAVHSRTDEIFVRHSARQLASVKRGSSDDAMEEGAGEEGQEGPEGPGRARRARKGQEGPEREQQVNFAIYCSSLATPGKRKVNSAACSTILHPFLAEVGGDSRPSMQTEPY